MGQSRGDSAKNWSSREIPDLAGKCAVVTGSNSGIGLETARALARSGARVVMACRSPERGRSALAEVRASAPEATVELAELDLASLESVAAFAAQSSRELPQLDILCNNAGIMMVPYGRTKDGFELQLGTNHLGHFALTAGLQELLLRAPAARIVNVSSTVHKVGKIDFDDLQSERSYNKTRAYGQSKLANLLFSYELERRLRAAGVSALSNASHPGYTQTNLQNTVPLFKAMGALVGQGPPDGALPTLFAATSPEAKGGEYYGPSRFFEMRGAPMRVSSSQRSHDVDMAERLWSVSEELTGVRFQLDQSA